MMPIHTHLGNGFKEGSGKLLYLTIDFEVVGSVQPFMHCASCMNCL